MYLSKYLSDSTLWVLFGEKTYKFMSVEQLAF